MCLGVPGSTGAQCTRNALKQSLDTKHLMVVTEVDVVAADNLGTWEADLC